MQDGKEAAIAALQTPVETPAPQNFALNFLWLEKNVAVSVDQLYDQGQSDRVRQLLVQCSCMEKYFA